MILDKLFMNGVVRSMDGHVYEAVGTQGGRIAFTGTNAEAKLLCGADTKICDLAGRLMLPGFVDTHMHFLGYGMTLEQADLISAKSKRELLDIGRVFLKTRPDTKWMFGSGWNQDHWSDDPTFPTRFDLDKISENVPIVFIRTCYHIISMNTLALKLNGITRDTPEVPGGVIDRDEHGEPTGIVRENACGLAYTAVPETTVEDVMNALRGASREAVKVGLTGIHTDDLGPCGENDLGMEWRAYEALRDRGELPVRVYMQCRLDDMRHLERFFELGYGFHSGDSMLMTGPLKIVADGSLGARTAFLNKPYNDAPDTCGMTCFTQEELDSLICTAASKGMPGAIHAIGDRSINMVLDAFEKARKIEKTRLRHAVIHCQITDYDMLRRIRAMDIMALVQPVFLDYDMHIADDRVGALAKTSYAFNTMTKLGIPMAFGSDCPVEFFDPIMGIYHAVTRMDKSGYPKGGWYPDERLTIDKAVAGFTTGAAYAANLEGERGSITLGKVADFTVLDRDIFTIPSEDIKNARVTMTVVSGKTVYEA